MIDLPGLWPPQQRAVCAALAAIAAGQGAGLWVMATGTGKTRAFLTLARLLGVPTLVLVHRDTLIRQTVAEAGRTWPEAAVGVIQAECDEWQADLYGREPDLVVASVPSLSAERLAAMPPDRFGLLVSDEAHRSVARGWSRAVAHFAVGFHLGVTATPDRLDRVGLGRHFGREPLIHYGIRQAIDEGVLVPVRQWAVKTGVVLDQVKANSRGKWDVEDLSKTVRVESRNRQVVGAYQQYAEGRLAVAFAVDVAHVHALAKEFAAACIPAVAITGANRDERDRQLAAFAAGKYKVAVNCEVLVEGADIRNVSCILWCRPTQSRLYYLQGIGRGLRLSPETGKTGCIVIDFVDASREHKLVTLCDLLGLKDRDAEGKLVLDLLKEQEEVQETARGQEQFLQRPLVWCREEVSPWPDLPSLAGYQPRKRWHEDPATDKQIRALRRMGVSTGRDLTKGEAAWLFERVREYDFVFPQPATEAQERFLRRHGEWQDGMGRRFASQRIGQIKQTVGEARGG